MAWKHCKNIYEPLFMSLCDSGLETSESGMDSSVFVHFIPLINEKKKEKKITG